MDNSFNAMPQAEDSGDESVRLDFSNVRYMNSATIDKLIRARKSAKLAGMDIVIANASPNVREVLNVTKLGKLFRFEGEDEG